MQRYRDALDHLNSAMVLIDQIGDTRLAAELSMPIAIIKRRIALGDLDPKAKGAILD